MKKYLVQTPDRLVNFIHKQLKDPPSLRALKRELEKNRCQVNGVTERFASYPLQRGDTVTFSYNSVQEKKPTTLYEDEHLLIVDKPAWTTCDDAFYPPYRLVHRLDQQTTGVLILAKNDETYFGMLRLFRNRMVKKSYLALVDKVPKIKSGTIDQNVKVVKRKGNQVICGTSPWGKPTITHWNIEKRSKTHALLRCQPETGRTHQIRVHLKELGHPILGDYHYCRKFNYTHPVQRVMLHARKVSFSHPITKEKIIVQAPIPKDFKQLIP